MGFSVFQIFRNGLCRVFQIFQKVILSNFPESSFFKFSVKVFSAYFRLSGRLFRASKGGKSSRDGARFLGELAKSSVSSRGLLLFSSGG